MYLRQNHLSLITHYLKMIEKGFNFVTIGADQRAMSTGAKAIVDKMKGSSNKKEESKAY